MDHNSYLPSLYKQCHDNVVTSEILEKSCFFITTNIVIYVANCNLKLLCSVLHVQTVISHIYTLHCATFQKINKKI